MGEQAAISAPSHLIAALQRTALKDAAYSQTLQGCFCFCARLAFRFAAAPPAAQDKQRRKADKEERPGAGDKINRRRQ